ncbi:hypothetical protein [Filimonas effusa]|uniref:YcxB family protein n=1 Tax=Filimonas effusa TaxID=2508721 RepID=A0A4Q1D8X0_9BACT|nr:hypothetical protein [Filimonas effusa]RXK85807.1 hypothetical protein ESB13_03065 [Filimonas effusa]
MEYDFLITLRKNKVNLFGYITQLMLFLSIAAFAMHLFDPIDQPTRIVFAVIIFLTFSFWILARLRFIGKKYDYTSYRLALYVCFFGWLAAPMPLMIIAFFFLAMALLEKPANLPPEIGFSEYGVSFNTFPKRTVKWDEITNVVLKDDLLTIDYKNNKLFQREIAPGTDKTTVKEFNDFCAHYTSNIL